MKDFTEIEKARFLSHVRKSADGCWWWFGALNEKGYGVVGIRGKTTKAHRLSYQMHVREITTEECLLHACDNPRCVNPEHLSVGDRSENNRDMIRKGRYNRKRINRGYRTGEDHQGVVYSDEQVLKIRQARERGMSYGKIHKTFGVSVVHAFRLCNNMVRKKEA